MKNLITTSQFLISSLHYLGLCEFPAIKHFEKFIEWEIVKSDDNGEETVDSKLTRMWNNHEHSCMACEYASASVNSIQLKVNDKCASRLQNIVLLVLISGCQFDSLKIHLNFFLYSALDLSFAYFCVKWKTFTLLCILRCEIHIYISRMCRKYFSEIYSYERLK